jgi:hypothetical protein
VFAQHVLTLEILANPEYMNLLVAGAEGQKRLILREGMATHNIDVRHLQTPHNTRLPDHVARRAMR